jgi:hypothetical protein
MLLAVCFVEGNNIEPAIGYRRFLEQVVSTDPRSRFTVTKKSITGIFVRLGNPQYQIPLARVYARDGCPQIRRRNRELMLHGSRITRGNRGFTIRYRLQ